MKHSEGRELRFFENPITIAHRDGDGDQPKNIVTGYAAVFGQLSRTIGWFREKIDPKAFEGRLQDDVVALFNHDMNLVLARTISNTLTLSVDETGLKYEFNAPDTTAGRDLLVSLKRGDVKHSSFSFTVAEDNWEEDEDGNEIRTILKVKRLYDVSPVVQPAYPQTSVDAAKRSYDEWKKETDKAQYDDLKDLESELAHRKLLIT